jgi:hypothetical protein
MWAYVKYPKFRQYINLFDFSSEAYEAYYKKKYNSKSQTSSSSVLKEKPKDTIKDTVQPKPKQQNPRTGINKKK